MALNLQAQAAQAAQQGQSQLSDYNNKASNYTGQYNDFTNQASAAGQGVSDYTKYMQGEGSAGNQYHKELGSQLGQVGYDPAQMTAARGNLNQATGAMSAYSDFANTAASKWGMNAGGFAAANAGALSGLNNNVAANQGVVNSMSDLYKTAQAGANQFTGQVVQGQHETLGGLQSTYANAANQRDSAASMINFYNKLAQDQGTLNAQQQQYYTQAQQAMASAQQLMAQSSLLMSQTTGQNQQNTKTQNGMDSQAYKDILSGKLNPDGSPKAVAATAPTINANNPGTSVTSILGSVNSGIKDVAGGVGNFFNHSIPSSFHTGIGNFKQNMNNWF